MLYYDPFLMEEGAMRRTPIPLVLVLFMLLLGNCRSSREGALEGRVAPPEQGVRITIREHERQVASVEAAIQDGSFRMALPAGRYDVSISAPSSPFPLHFPGIVVKAGEVTVLPPIALRPVKATASIRGTVKIAGGAARVTLLDGATERASINTSKEGTFEIEGLPAGAYTMRLDAAGYAPESRAVTVADHQNVELTVRMLYVTALAGADWNKGTLMARGIGLPPKQAPTPTIRREMAKRAALTDAERNLLRALEMVQTGPGEQLTTLLGEQAVTQKLHGYLQGYRITAERDLDGGKVEVELELPLTGPRGLSSYLDSP
jgi:hypothetical protein